MHPDRTHCLDGWVLKARPIQRHQDLSSSFVLQLDEWRESGGDKGYRGYPHKIETPEFISPNTSEMGDEVQC